MKNGQFKFTGIDFYKECDEKGLAELRKISEKRMFKKGETICKPDDRGMVYIVSKGRVQHYLLTDEGKKIHT